MKKTWVLIFILLLFPIFIYSAKLEKDGYFKGIHGNAGHLGISFSAGIEIFTYANANNLSSLKYVFGSKSSPVKLNAMITYFATDLNRYSFLIGANIGVSSSFISYNSFFFGFIDSLYFNKYFSFDFGLITVFEGNYNFFLNLGVSYYFFRGRNYSVFCNSSFNFLLNSFNINNNFYLGWMYIF